jgi:branched-chain amino acid transport system substrate-binding protein
MKTLAALLAGLALTGSLALPGSAADPYQFDVIAPMTGGGAFIGKGTADLVSVIEGVINKSGGIRGRPVKFVIHDDATSPQQDVQIINDIIAHKGIVVTGPDLVADCGAIAPLIKSAGPVVYCGSTGIHPDEGSYMFSCGVSTADTIAASVRYFHDRGFKKMAIMTSTDATGQDADRIIDGIFATPEIRDAAIVAREHFAVGDVSVAAQIARIRASGAQALVAWTTGTPLGTILRAASDGGLDIPVVSGPGNLTYAQMKAYTGIMPREMYFPSPPALVPDTLPNGAVKKAVVDFQAAYKAAGIRPDIATTIAWDSIMLMVDALRKFGPDASAAQVREYIAAARFSGVNGSYDFRAHPQRGLDANAVVVVRWDPAKDTWIGVSRFGGRPL